MDIKKIVGRFSVLANISLNDASKWFNLCRESADEIKSQLREGINEKNYEDRLNAAAAVLSFYKYILCTASKITSVSITTGTNSAASGIADRKNMIEAANLMWKNTRASISDILKDPDFIFKGVK